MPHKLWAKRPLLGLLLGLPMCSLGLSNQGGGDNNVAINAAPLVARSTLGAGMPTVLATATIDGSELVFLDESLTVIKRVLVKGRDAKSPSRIGAIQTASTRNSFLVTLRDAPEMWEVRYDRTAPEIALGMVHDFQYREGDFVPGYLNPQRIALPSPALALTLCPSGDEVLTTHASGAAPDGVRVQLVRLDARRAEPQATCPP